MRSEKVTTLSPESIEQFRDSLFVRGRSEHTVKSYSSDLRQLLLEVGTSSVELSELEETGMRWLTQHRATLKPKTTTRRLTSLRAFARWAGLGNAFAEYVPPTPGRPQPKPLVERMDGVRAMIEAADEPMKVVVALCGFAGLRISEALSVNPAQVNFRDKTITVRGKGDKERTVPMSAELASVITPTVVRQFGSDRLVYMADRVAREKITRLGELVGLKYGVSSHHLRATFATTLMENSGGDLRLVQELLGHASSRTTEAYTQVTKERMAKAVNDL